jgi:inorganic pyrophosphatase
MDAALHKLAVQDSKGLYNVVVDTPKGSRNKYKYDEGTRTWKEQASSAMKAGFDAVLFKPVALTEIKAVLTSVVVSDAGHSSKRAKMRARPGTERRLPIDEARRIRNERKSKTLTKRQQSVMASFAFKRSIWDGGRGRSTPISSKTFWWSAFSMP